MTRISAVVAMSLLSVAPGAIAGTTLLLNTPVGGAPSVDVDHGNAIRDVGCIGYHGTASGYARDGKCV